MAHVRTRVSTRVRALEGVRERLHLRAFVGAGVSVCVCALAGAGTHEGARTCVRASDGAYVRVYVCVSVCICVCFWAPEWALAGAGTRASTRTSYMST